VGAGLVDAAAAAPRPRLTVGGVSGLTNNRAAAVTFSANRAANFTCKLDTAAAAPCTSPFAPPSLRDGGHSVTITGTDALGHAAAATRSFTLDTVAPATSVTSGPAGPTKERRPTFGFASEAGVSFTCAFDGGGRGPCSAGGSHRPGSALGDGSHTFNVTAVDRAGNAATGTRTFVVDTKRPTVKVKKHPRKTTRNRKAKFTFLVSEKRTKLRCKVDKRKFRRCKTKSKFTVKRGKHKLRVKATDLAGNVSRVRKFAWRVTR
jgi:hypothetical protein